MTFDDGTRVCMFGDVSPPAARGKTGTNMYNSPPAAVLGAMCTRISSSLQSYHKGASGSHLWSLHYYWEQFLRLPSDDGDEVCEDSRKRASGIQARIDFLALKNDPFLKVNFSEELIF